MRGGTQAGNQRKVWRTLMKKINQHQQEPFWSKKIFWQVGTRLLDPVQCGLESNPPNPALHHWHGVSKMYWSWGMAIFQPCKWTRWNENSQVKGSGRWEYCFLEYSKEEDKLQASFPIIK
jgi:hypothetical protein